MAKRRPPALGAYGRPTRMRWRPVIGFGSLFWGVILGLGSAVLLQQYSLQVLTRENVLRTFAVALAVAIVLPSIGRAVGVRRYNKTLRKAGLL